MTRIIVCTSGKGGVGKTTLASNLAYALAELGQEVIAVDANLTTPNLGLHYGLHLAPRTLHDVLKDKSSLKDATYIHPYGFKIVPASMSIDDLTSVDVGKLPEVTMSMLGKADFVVMDCSAGLGREAVSAIAASDEILLVTNPDLPSVADALKTASIAKQAGKSVIGVVVNRVRGRVHELTREEIEEMIGMPVLAEIPEDGNVARSIMMKKALVEYDPHSPAAVEIRRLAHRLVGRPFEYKRPSSFRLLENLVRWMTG